MFYVKCIKLIVTHSTHAMHFFHTPTLQASQFSSIGKTTLLHRLWGVGGRTGHFLHTDVPTVYEVHRRVLVVDFPGSDSLDYHAKTFSVCGAMNNLLVVVVPYTGDVSQLASKEVARVFGVMAGSDSTQVVLCINKCGYGLPEAIR